MKPGLSNTAVNEPSEDMNDRVLGNLSTAILLLNDQMCVLFSNQAAESLLQESSIHLQEKCLTSNLANGAELAEIVEAALSTDKVYTRRQMQLLIPGKEDVTADVTVTPILGSGQALVELAPVDRYLRIDRDAALKEHSDVTRQMAREMAHEIKNPLGGIKGSAQLLAKELAEPSLHEYTDIIIEETDRLTSLVDRMLGPTTVPDITSLNIHEVLERVSKLVELESGGMIIERDYDPSIPDLNGDVELLTQAILNIARNAMQILAETEDPAITIRTRIDRQFTIGGQRHKVILRIDIEDNGPGIDDDIQEHLFYPMISRRPGGTGLGLTFAQSIINQHQGMIEFSSVPGETTFRIFLPLE